MRSNSEIRQIARANLGYNIFSNKWLTLLGFFALVDFVLALLNSAVGIAGLFLTGALSMGLAAVCLLVLRQPQNPMQLQTLLYGFQTDNYVRSLGIHLLSRLFILGWTLLFYIPGIVKSYSYSMAYYISLDMPEMSGIDCITESRRIMDGNKAQLFLLDLSFLGWYILGFMAFGIGILFVVPYHEMAKAVFYEELVRTQTGTSQEV